MFFYKFQVNLIILFTIIFSYTCGNEINIENIEVIGPGLKPDIIVMPARYFYIYFRGRNYDGGKSIDKGDFEVKITGNTKDGRNCQLWPNILNRSDSSFIVRYKLYETCFNFYIIIKYQTKHVAKSPYFFKGPIQPDDCYCPQKDIDKWLEDYECNKNYNQLQTDLNKYTKVDFDSFYGRAVERLNNSKQSSVCNYVVKSNKVYRNCYGQHTGFKMFMDAILISLTRKVVLPDFEIFSNLGDWPLMDKENKDSFPMFSWCGSKDTLDIVMPTYDLTEASLQCLGRVSLDMLSVQGNIEKKWSEKAEKCFWRGRDSSPERLSLIGIARQHPDLFNASLTNFFFYRDKEHIYGPKTDHVSFFKFFDYKYQLNLDGTVAAYRFPFLLIGDSVVFKQDSPYYEHFYSDLTPWVHYIPVKRDLSNLVQLIKWAKRNDDKIREISKAGHAYAENNLLPQHVFCYHATLFNEWSKKLISSVRIREGMELAEEPESKGCYCENVSKDEL
ncbi:hypothetical protein O3M35_004983 [Rhynocoris fuscipes]|uniref:Glycosyl transferase CAP10 domain-containing protein n=1 Tax=Rhynocoris fuscipes TaxID=488301 RepID=A0AAW1DH31_9HEMI